MASVADVVEISSDEEDFSGLDKLPIDDLGWVSDLLDEDDDGIGDGLDDIVVMDEFSAPPVSLKKDGCDVGGGGGDAAADDDDDCLVLDGDPDKPVSVAEEEGDDGDGSDELQIVGEKGQLACRDFPHPRHLCASLPFSTTSHVKHCNMCHCFVCDSPAPCTYWGNGTSVTDHCHATDKDAKWKTLRQSFKRKNLPASHPEKLHPVMPLSQQDTLQSLCQVSVPQPLPSLRSNIFHPRPAGRTPILNTVGQKQQMHPSIRVSQHVGRAVCAQKATGVPRAGRGVADAYVTQVTYSRTRFKRVGAAPLGYATPNANRSQSGFPSNVQMHRALPHRSQPAHMTPGSNVSTGTFQNNPPQRSVSAPIVSQRPQGQPAATLELSPDRAHITGPQLSRCTSLTTQRKQCPPEPLADVSSKSWQDILASVASELGVSDYSINTTMAQQPLSTSFQPLQSGQLPSHGNSSQGVDLRDQSVAAMHLKSFDRHGLSNDTTGQNVQADDPMQTAQPLNQLNSESNLTPRGTHLNSFVASPGEEILIGAAHQLESSKLNSSELPFDFKLDSWGI